MNKCCEAWACSFIKSNTYRKVPTEKKMTTFVGIKKQSM